MAPNTLQLGPGRPLILLGPQRPEPNLQEAIETLPGSGPIVTLTAGWRHDEGDHAALHGHIGDGAVSLPLYRWFDEILREEPELAAAYKERQAQLKRLKLLHRIRQHPALDGVKRLLALADDDKDLVRPQLLWALEDVRRIDDQLIRQSDAIRRAHPHVLQPWTHPRVAPRHREAVSMIREARGVCIAGGHVAVLRNRIDFFGLGAALSQAKSMVAWSAGAMVLTRRIVLFYDDPPEGSSHAELLDEGLGLLDRCVLLPHARRRLRLDDASRISLLATRFAPHTCIALENGAWLDRVGKRWVNRGTPGTASVLGFNGQVTPLEETSP